MSALLQKCSRHKKITENLVGPGVGGGEGPTLGTDTMLDVNSCIL